MNIIFICIFAQVTYAGFTDVEKAEVNSLVTMYMNDKAVNKTYQNDYNTYVNCWSGCLNAIEKHTQTLTSKSIAVEEENQETEMYCNNVFNLYKLQNYIPIIHASSFTPTEKMNEIVENLCKMIEKCVITNEIKTNYLTNKINLHKFIGVIHSRKLFMAAEILSTVKWALEDEGDLFELTERILESTLNISDWLSEFNYIHLANRALAKNNFYYFEYIREKLEAMNLLGKCFD